MIKILQKIMLSIFISSTTIIICYLIAKLIGIEAQLIKNARFLFFLQFISNLFLLHLEKTSEIFLNADKKLKINLGITLFLLSLNVFGNLLVAYLRIP